MSDTRIKTFLTALIVLVLFLPATIAAISVALPGSRLMKVFVESNLVGVVLDEPKPELSSRSWFNGSYQASYTRWFGQRFALRGLLVRASNQFDYSLFRRSSMDDGQLVIGKRDQLFERCYLTEYNGGDPPMPVERLESIVVKIHDLQTRLQNRGVAFVLLISPSKASVYPEYVPDAYARSASAPARNYDNLVPLLVKHSVHFVDGHQITTAEVRRGPYPLFAQGGIHWNGLGAADSLQALLKKIRDLSPVATPQLVEDQIALSPTVSRKDEDLALLLNVLLRPNRYPSPELHLHFEPASAPGKIVFVGGSFLERPLDILNSNHVFGSMDYYRYWHSKITFPIPSKTPVDPSNLDWDRQIFSANAVVLEINEEALQLGQQTHYTNFLDDALRHLAPSGQTQASTAAKSSGLKSRP